MSSPFSTYQEFYEAKGAIYTFADRPVLIGILIGVAALVFLYFIYFTFTIKKDQVLPHNPVLLSVLILTGAFSLANTIYTHSIQRQHDRPSGGVRQEQSSAQPSRTHPLNRLNPLVLLGVMGSSATVTGRGKRHRHRQGDRARAARHRPLR